MTRFEMRNSTIPNTLTMNRLGSFRSLATDKEQRGEQCEWQEVITRSKAVDVLTRTKCLKSSKVSMDWPFRYETQSCMRPRFNNGNEA